MSLNVKTLSNCKNLIIGNEMTVDLVIHNIFERCSMTTRYPLNRARSVIMVTVTEFESDA